MAPALFTSRRLTDPGEYTRTRRRRRRHALRHEPESRRQGYRRCHRQARSRHHQVRAVRQASQRRRRQRRPLRPRRADVRRRFQEPQGSRLRARRSHAGHILRAQEVRPIRQVRPAERSRNSGRRHDLRQRSELVERHRPHLANYARGRRKGARRGDDLRQRAHGP